MNITNLTLIKLYFKLCAPQHGSSVASQGDHGTREDPEWTPRRLFSVGKMERTTTRAGLHNPPYGFKYFRSGGFPTSRFSQVTAF